MEHQRVKRTTLHEQVAEQIRDEVLVKLCPGDKLETEAKLARRFDVSRNTIREAMTTFVHEGLIERRAGRGTIVRQRRPEQAQHVALVIAVGLDHTRLGYYFLRLIEFMHQFFSQTGLVPRLYWARQGSEAQEADASLGEFKRALAHHEVAGIVLLKGPFGSDWWTAVKGAGVPHVGGDRKDAQHAVRLDCAELLNEAVGFLARTGRRRLGLLAWNPETPPHPEIVGEDLTPVFREVVRQHGCETCDGWTRGDLWPGNPGAGYAMFREMWMAQAAKPDGLVVSDDVLFPDIATAILEIGIRVPEDLLVVTHANKGSGIFYPFPTVRMEYDPDETGNILGSQLLQLLRKEAVAEGIVKLPFRWIGVDVVRPRLVNRPFGLPKLQSAGS